jgi:hypothetical protein
MSHTSSMNINIGQTELYSTPPPVSRPLDFTNGTNRRPTTTMVKKIKRLHNILN